MVKPTVVAYKTHDGTSATLSRLHFDSLLDLNLACGKALRIPPEAVIAFFADGEQIREENVVQLGSEGKTEVYVYSREVLQSHPQTIISSLLLQPSLPPARPTPVLADLESLLPSIPPLLKSLRIQHRSLSLAALNLGHHLSALSSTYETALVPFAVAELEKERKLLREYDVWMFVVGRIKVSDKVLGGKKAAVATGSPERTLGSYISRDKMGLVKEKAEAAYMELEARFEQVRSAIDGLQSGSEEVQSAIAAFGCEEAEECGKVAERALDRARQVHTDTPELRDLDLLIRQKIELLLEIKNAFSSHLINTLHRISDLQSTIAHLPPILSALEMDLRSPPGFNHIFRFSIMPAAYGRLLVEGVRRREFVAFYLSRSSSLAETLAKMISTERRRRQSYKHDPEAQLPWDIGSAMDGTPPTTEVNNVGGLTEEAFKLDRADLDSYLSVLVELERDPELLGLVDKGSPNPVAELRLTLGKHIDKMDRLPSDFDKLAEKTIMSGSRLARSRRPSTADLTALQTLTERNQTLEQEALAAHTTIRGLQDNVVGLEKELSTVTSSFESERSRSQQLEAGLASLRSERTAELETLDRIKATSESQVSDLTRERSTLRRELAQARMQVQDLDVQLAGSRAQVRTTNVALAQAREQQEKSLKAQVAEADALLRDHVAEADGDRAVLEHQIADGQAALDKLKIDSEASLKALRDKSTREMDGVKAELKLQKAQLREAQVTRTAAEEASSKVSSDAAAREQELEGLLHEAVRIAHSFRDVDERLLETVRTSSLGSSLSLPPPNHPLEGSRLTSTPADTLATLAGYDLRAFEDMVLKTVRLIKKWQQKYNEHKEKARDKIAVSHFSPGDVALFLPTRNFTAALRPWAAFNVNFPHFFLDTNQDLADHLLTREYYLARISSITEKTVDPKSLTSSTNVGLPVGSTYFVVDTTPFAPTPLKPRARRTSSMTSTSALPNTPTPARSGRQRVASSTLADTPESPLASPVAGMSRRTPGTTGLAMPHEGTGGGYFSLEDSRPAQSTAGHVLPLTQPPPPLTTASSNPFIVDSPPQAALPAHLSPSVDPTPASLPSSRRPSNSSTSRPAIAIPRRPASVASSNGSHPSGSWRAGGLLGMGGASGGKAPAAPAVTTTDAEGEMGGLRRKGSVLGLGAAGSGEVRD